MEAAKNNPSMKRKLMLQIDASFAAYQIVINAEKRKEYDEAIGLPSMEEEKRNEVNSCQQDYDVKGSFEDDDEEDEVNVSLARKSNYVQLSPIIAESAPKLLDVSPQSPEPSPHDEVDEIITPPAHHEKSKPQDRVSLDKDLLDEPIISPTMVSEFDNNEHRIAIATDDDDDASYTSLHKSGRSRRSRRKPKKKSSRRRQREKKKAISTRSRDVESDDEEELDIFALYLNTCPCVQSTDEYGSDEESVLYD